MADDAPPVIHHNYDPFDPFDDMTEMSFTVRRAVVERLTQLRMEVNRWRDEALELRHYKSAWQGMKKDRPRYEAALAAITWADSLDEAIEIAKKAMDRNQPR